ncbi:MAG: helix-turn-helix domain-containing protein [Cupriavidus sp.]|nr:helix-turn-helix domain-containing protein [Cupriavidus sp.]
MCTIDLAAAAEILGAHPETVRLKAKAGLIPGRKVGKRWVFSTVALERYLAGEWDPKSAQDEGTNEAVSTLASKQSNLDLRNAGSTRPSDPKRRYREALAPARARKGGDPARS